MSYMGDRSWWDARFKARAQSPMRHEQRLEADISLLKPEGRVLELACGDGRNALYLARLGFTVYAVDFSEEALRRLRRFAKDEGLDISSRLVNLAEDDFSDLGASFDAIIINHYRLPKPQYEIIPALLKPEGILWVNGFAALPADNPNVTENDLLRDEDLEFLGSISPIKKELYHDGLFVRYIWSK